MEAYFVADKCILAIASEIRANKLSLATGNATTQTQTLSKHETHQLGVELGL